MGCIIFCLFCIARCCMSSHSLPLRGWTLHNTTHGQSNLPLLQLTGSVGAVCLPNIFGGEHGSDSNDVVRTALNTKFVCYNSNIYKRHIPNVYINIYVYKHTHSMQCSHRVSMSNLDTKYFRPGSHQILGGYQHLG